MSEKKSFKKFFLKKLFTQFYLKSTQLYHILLSFPSSGTQFYQIPLFRGRLPQQCYCCNWLCCCWWWW